MLCVTPRHQPAVPFDPETMATTAPNDKQHMMQSRGPNVAFGVLCKFGLQTVFQ